MKVHELIERLSSQPFEKLSFIELLRFESDPKQSSFVHYATFNEALKRWQEQTPKYISGQPCPLLREDSHFGIPTFLSN